MVEVLDISDPACPWSWAAEPALRRIHHEFGAQVTITYVMARLARELDDGLHEVVEALEASAWGGMPVDPRGWTARPPRSTYPARQAP